MKNILFKFISAAICAVAFNACGAEVNAALSEIPEEKLTEMTMQANDIAFSFINKKRPIKTKISFSHRTVCARLLQWQEKVRRETLRKK